ncbi:secreted and transmembrane protein 1A-like isoform X2 [Cavia porcellus]|uniref:secreted and transmembrane protein 1A-like isoform X2 n=1 Tax=Cavia porcellus TaxID=10141 RepID=UPI000661F735|nr:secreted and transmembrane protein 1A-like isoform X1 [Cavia porcellus]
MSHCPMAPPSRVFQMFGALLLLAASLSAQNTRWDRPTCTEGVVSVSRGGRAVLACNSSNPFVYITIRLCTHGQNQTIFDKKTPGNFSMGAWQLEVRGGWAQLVIQPTQDAHAGLYLWHLQGLQRHNKETRLNVSEPQEHELERGPLLSMSPEPQEHELEWGPLLSMSPEPRPPVGVVAAVLFLVLGLAGIIVFTQCWPPSSGRFYQMKP